jgi:hypothetical protein
MGAQTGDCFLVEYISFFVDDLVECVECEAAVFVHPFQEEIQHLRGKATE